ncbi:MAG TPA: right-handed parallel beta-helix repeat-containing protein [Burkholderiaceae bacterium]|nr:right-handed parallel beta-helix repeat-containing protein [Burkholderiaceae bacterium]
MLRTLRSIFCVLATSFALVAPSIAKTITVHAGESIRAALERANPGDRVQVMPGTYREGQLGDLNALTINKSGIDLIGMSLPNRPVVLDNAGGQSYGIWVSPPDSSGEQAQSDTEHPPCGLVGTSIHGFSLSGFTVRGFGLHGVHLACVDGFALSRNVADANGEYGLFPIVSKNGSVSGNEVMNTQTDAGIYVGQSENVAIRDNHVHDNLLGIEVENSVSCSVEANRVHDNSFGIFVDLLPFLERKVQDDTRIVGNQVYNNNRRNTAEPDDLLGALPPGIGILLTGADRTMVSGNAVTGNQFAGIGVTSLCLAFALQGQTCDGIDIEPNPDGNRIVGNLVLGNGGIPVGIPVLDALRADLVWDGTGTGNCWQGNTYATSVPAALSCGR